MRKFACERNVCSYNANGWSFLPESSRHRCPNTARIPNTRTGTTGLPNTVTRIYAKIREYGIRQDTGAGVNTLAIMLKAWPPSRVGPSASRAVADRADRTVRRVPVTNAPPHAAAAERHKMTAESNGRHIAAPCGGTATGARATINVRTRARPVPYRPSYGGLRLRRATARAAPAPRAATDGRPPRGTVRPRERPYRGRRNVRAAGRPRPPERPVKRETAWPGLSSLAGRGIIKQAKR